MIAAKLNLRILLVTPLLLLAACSSVPKSERGPDGTRAYYINIETSDPGVRIEADNENVGTAPLKLKIYGDEDGTFHNFGSSDYVIRAFPSNTNQFIQTKIFRTGGWFSQEDRIPSRLYFDMNQKTAGFSVDIPPRY